MEVLAQSVFDWSRGYTPDPETAIDALQVVNWVVRTTDDTESAMDVLRVVNRQTAE